MANVYNSLDNTLVSGTSKADYIQNVHDYTAEVVDGYGENVTIKALAGNDTISNDYSDNVTIIGGKGNDSIKTYGKNILIQYAKGDGNDTVIGFDSDDTLHITKGKYSTMKSGNNFIVNVGSGKIILKNALADKSNSINIQDSSGKVVTYNDWTVWNGSIKNNIKNNVTLAGSKNADTIGNFGNGVLIKGNAGNDKISNSGDYVSINSGAGQDTISNYGNHVTIDAGAGNDYISNGDGLDSLSDVSINSGAGNDTIHIDGGGSWEDLYPLPSIKNLAIDGGKGNDLITLENVEGSDNISINGGAGNDTIYNDFYDLTITGGAGNDLISLDSDFAGNNVIKYSSGDGDDTVIGFNSDDILHITSGDYVAEISGDDLVVTVGKGKIILKDAADEEISILTTKKYSNVSDLFAEDNLSEIVAEKSVGEFENYKSDFKQENLITFAE